MYYRSANVVLAVYDVTSLQSFDSLKYWVGQVKQYAPDCKVVVVGNKTDSTTVVNEQEVHEYCLGFNMRHYKVGAKQGTGVEQLFAELAGLSCRSQASLVKYVDASDERDESKTKGCCM